MSFRDNRIVLPRPEKSGRQPSFIVKRSWNKPYDNKTPTPEDADLLQMYKAIKAEDFNFDAWESFLERLKKEEYIKMEELS